MDMARVEWERFECVCDVLISVACIQITGARLARGAVCYERLVRVKNTYDPTNFFRMNQNIAPTG